MQMNIRTWPMSFMCWLPTTALAHGQDAKQFKEPSAKPWITKETQEAIDAGLAFLAKEQKADGSWGTRQYEGSVGITGITGLAFLSAGHRPGQGRHGEVVAKAVEYLLKRGKVKHFRFPLG